VKATTILISAAGAIALATFFAFAKRETAAPQSLQTPSAQASRVLSGEVARWSVKSLGQVAAGSPVCSWPDSSGNNHPASQAARPNCPVMGQGTAGSRFLRFDGDDWFSFPRLRVQSAVFVVRHHSGTSTEYETVLGDPTTYEWLGSYGTTLFEGIASSIPPIANGRGYLNGKPMPVMQLPKPSDFEVITVIPTGPVGISTIANDRNVSGRYWNGDFEEIRLYDRKLTEAEVSQVSDGLKTEYSLRLPAQIVTDGNSLTAESAARTGQDYPSQLIPLLTPSIGRYDTFNVAIGGQITPYLFSTAPSRVDSLLDKSRPRSILVFWEGSNHLTDVSNGVVSAQIAFEEISRYCRARRAAGWTVVVLTVLPRSDTYAVSNFEQRRVLLNSLIRAHWTEFSDALADVALNSSIGSAGSEIDTGFYNPGRVHLNSRGNAVVASVVRNAIVGLK